MTFHGDNTIPGATREGKWRMIMPLVFAAFLYGGIDYLENQRPSHESGWIKTIGTPLQQLSAFFGEGTYSYRLYSYWTLLVLFALTILLIPYFWTKNPRYLFFAFATAPLLIVIEDWSANIWGGSLMPTWDGPAHTGFTMGLPTFYWPFLVWGLIALIIWIFYERKLTGFYKMHGELLR